MSLGGCKGSSVCDGVGVWVEGASGLAKVDANVFQKSRERKGVCGAGARMRLQVRAGEGVTLACGVCTYVALGRKL